MVCTTCHRQLVFLSKTAYDPDNNNLIEIPVPSETSFVQFMASDGDNNVWFVEQQTGKIGTIKMTEIPVIASQVQSSGELLELLQVIQNLHRH